MRMFVAVLPPADALEHLEEFLEPRRAVGADLRWAAPGRWHVTLAFMADVHERSLDDLVERLERAAGRRTPFEVSLAGGGAFPDPARARVLYAAVTGVAGGGPDGPDAELARLAAGARTAAATAGARVDGTRFQPHVTLARTGRPTEVTRWLRVLDGYRGPDWPVGEVALLGSHLGEGARGRPRHEVVATCPVGG